MGKAPVVEDRQKAPQAPAAPTCQHHWIIETPRGATSNGRCKRCGEERLFRNSTGDYVWDDYSGNSGYSPWSGRRPTAKVIDDEEAAMGPRSGGEPVLAL